MKSKYLVFFLIVGLASLAINAQERGYTVVTEPETSKKGSKTNTASIITRVTMGILGVVCYELKECRESLAVQAISASIPSQPTETPYTFLPQFDVNTSKSSFVPSNLVNNRNSSNVNSRVPSFFYQLAPNWTALPDEKAGTVTIYPYGQGGRELKTAIILGVTPNQSGNIYTEAQNYVNRMVKSNPYLSNHDSFKNETIGNRECYYKQLSGFSKAVNANEAITFFGCKLNQNTMFYTVLLLNDKTTEFEKQSFWQIWNSVELGN